MWFWWFMFICDLIIPITFIVCGRMMWKHTPEKINSLIGYRTSRSMKNRNTWKFAQIYCGKLWWKIGWIIVLPSTIIQIPFYNSSENDIGTLGGILVSVQCVILILSIIPTEIALRKNFTEDGIRR